MPAPTPQVYGGLYQGGVDAENPFGNEGVRVVRRMRVASSTESDPARQRFLWCVRHASCIASLLGLNLALCNPNPNPTHATIRWVLGPAITLLLVMAVSVGVVYQNNSANSVATRGGLDMPTLGAPQGPAPLTAALDAGTAAALGDTIEAPEPVADDDASAVDPVVDDADADDTKPAPKMNATAVLSCLEDKCQPLVTQLGKTWRELGACVRACVHGAVRLVCGH